jgi:hypothetical protein
MDATTVLTYIAAGVAIALIVFALLTISGKRTGPNKTPTALRVVVSVTVGFVIAFSLATHASVVERNKSLVETHAAVHGVGEESEPTSGSETGFGPVERGGEAQANDDEEEEEEEEEDEDEQGDEPGDEGKEMNEQGEDEHEEREDASKIWQRSDWKYAGHASQSKVAAKKIADKAKAGLTYLNRNETHPLATLLGNMITHDGMRPVEDSTLYARESYRTHQANEYGEGMDQRYVDPSLKTYDLAFAAYGKQRIIKPRILSVNAPMHF